MVLVKNPKFGVDQAFAEGASRVANLLWETTNGNLSEFPKSYLENLRHEYADGNVSMLEIIDRVDLGEGATYEDYCEVVDALMSVDPSQWPKPDSIVELPVGMLLHEFEPDLDFSEFNWDTQDFAEEQEVAVAEGPQGAVAEEATVQTPAGNPNLDQMSTKMEAFLKKVIASVYRDGVTEITDAQGNPPNAANNYLLSDDGKTFSGIFYDSPPGDTAKKFPFEIINKGGDNWQIKY